MFSLPLNQAERILFRSTIILTDFVIFRTNKSPSSSSQTEDASDDVSNDEDEKKLIRGKFKTKQSKHGNGQKGNQKFADEDDKEDKEDEDEENPTEETKKKHGHRRKQSYHEREDSSDDSEEDKSDGTKKHQKFMKNGSKRKHKSRAHGLKKTLSHEDESEPEEEHSVDESDLEYEDEDESETEKVPKPRRKKKKGKEKLLEEDQDIDNDDKEEIDMSIHMLDKAKGFGGLRVEDSDSDSNTGGTGNDGNVELSTEDQQPSYVDTNVILAKHKKHEADDEEYMVNSKQKSKKLFGSSLSKKSTRKKLPGRSGSKLRNMTFVVTQDNDNQYNVHMRTIDEHAKDDADGNEDVDEKEDEIAKKFLRKK